MRHIIVLIILYIVPLPLWAAEASPDEKLAPIHHIIVFYLENHSFDNLFGTFPGADGIANAGDKAIQIDASGKPYAILPRIMNKDVPDMRFPEKLSNAPFLISHYVPAKDMTGDLIHRFYQNQQQI